MPKNCYDDFVNKILQGDALNNLQTLPSESIDSIITSPPYWALRDYKTEGIIWDGDSNCEHEWNEYIRKGQTGGTKSDKVRTKGQENFQIVPDTKQNFCSKCNAWKGQLGQEPTIDLYINHLVSIFDEAKRVLKKEGTCWVVIGDTYAGTGHKGDYKDPKYENGRNGQEIALNNKIEGIKDKSLCMIPQRFGIKMLEHGWIARNIPIWHKNNCMPSSAKDRFTVDYEYVYFFTKSQKYYFKTQYEPALETSWATKKRKEGFKESQGPKFKELETNNYARLKGLGWYPHGRIKRCVWTINTTPFKEAHFAVFPEELVKQCLDAGCPQDNGIVLDPFMGSGTTALVALKNNRKFIGIELNKSYIDIAMKRIDPYLKQQKLVYQ